MIRTLARWWARRKYVWKIEIEAVTQDLQANLSAQRAKEKRSLATQLRKEAEDMETRVQQMAEMEEKGFWLCDNGQEFEEKPFGGCTKCEPIGDKVVPVKFIKRSEMTGQEKYKSDKGDRKSTRLNSS